MREFGPAVSHSTRFDHGGIAGHPRERMPEKGAPVTKKDNVRFWDRFDCVFAALLQRPRRKTRENPLGKRKSAKGARAQWVTLVCSGGRGPCRAAREKQLGGSLALPNSARLYDYIPKSV